MSSFPAKVLCLGIDAANPSLLRDWAADGSLPVLQALFDRGLSAELRGIEGFFVGSTWPSLYTGVSPAQHGFHYLVQLQPETYDFHRPADHGISWTEPFWTRLSEAGRRVAILDVPLSKLDPTLNGIQVVEWGGHDSVFGFQASTASLTETIRSRFGTHPLGRSCDGVRRTAEDYEAFLAKLTRGVRTKAELTRHLLQEGGWDLFMQVFTESHCAGHQCWHLHDPTHPAYDPGIAGATGDPLRRVYQAIDTAIGDILESAGDALVIVFSAHGMSHWYGAGFLLRDLLFQLGVATPKLTLRAPLGVFPRALSIVRWGWRRIPRGVRSLLAPLRHKLQKEGGDGGQLPTIGVDFSCSQCFPIPNGLAVGGIRLNLKGREPQGILDASEKETFCAGLIQDLLEVKDVRTGRPLIRSVRRTSDLYSGKHLDRLPDLLVEWDDLLPIGSTELGEGVGSSVRAFSEKAGTLEGRNEYGRSGEHRPDGFLLAVGPGVRACRLARSVPILDLAPTLTGLLGVDLPDSEGRPIAELLEADPPWRDRNTW